MSEEEARERLALFAPDGKRRWKLMPVWALNEAPTFVEMTMKLKIEWATLAKERGLKFFASKIIVDGVLLYGRTSGQLLAYFRTVIDPLKHHLTALKLIRYKWFQNRCKFIGMEVAVGGTQPAHSKNEAFFQARASKCMGRPRHAHWDLRLLQPVIPPICDGNQTLEVHLV